MFNFLSPALGMVCGWVGAAVTDAAARAARCRFRTKPLIAPPSPFPHNQNCNRLNRYIPPDATMKLSTLAFAATALLLALAAARPAAAQSAEAKLAVIENFESYCQELTPHGCASFTVAMLHASDESAAGVGECTVSSKQQAAFKGLSRDVDAWTAFYTKVGALVVLFKGFRPACSFLQCRLRVPPHPAPPTHPTKKLTSHSPYTPSGV